jgi:hypothetical protein
MAWSVKHHNYCQKQKMWAGTVNLACYIYKDCKPDEIKEKEIDMAEFRRYLMRTKGDAYDRTYYKKMIHQLEEKSNDAIVILRDYGKGIYKVLVRPISFAIENGKSKRESRLTVNAGNPMFSEAHKKRLAEQQQQEKDIDQMQDLLAKLGMKYSRSVLIEMWRKSSKCLDEFRGAVDFMLHCHHNQTKPVTNAHGWLRSCILRGDHLNFLRQVFHKLPSFKDSLELNAFRTCYLYQDEPDDKTKTWAESKVPKIFNPWDDPVPIPSQ